MRNWFINFTMLASVALSSIVLTQPALAQSANADDSLYQQLGGEPGISQMVEELIYEIGGDERIADQFADTDIDRFHRTLTEQICEISGGPCRYTGDDMVKVHTGLNITNADMNALVENLYTAMERQDIPVAAQNRLLSLLAEMHKDVVGL